MTSILRAASVVSAMTLASRILGFVRDVMMFRLLGTGAATGTFALAWLFPNLLRRWFGEGALTAAFVPAYTRAVADDGEAGGRRLLAAVTGVLCWVLGPTIVVVVAVALLFAAGSSAADDVDARLLPELVAILFPYALPICVLAMQAGALNATGRFAGAAAAPVVLNLFWIGALWFASVALNGAHEATVRTMAWFLLAGGVAQLLLTAVPLARRGLLARPTWPKAGDPARAVFRAMVPTALGLSITQVSILVNQLLAWHFVRPGANSYVYLADRLSLFPHALTSFALATAMFPRFAALAVRGEHAELRRAIDASLRYTLFLAVPASVGMIALGDDLFSICFGSANFDDADAAIAAATTAALVAGLPFLGCAQLLARVLFALGRLGTPARIAAVLFGVNLALNFAFLGLGLGVAGLTLATSCCSLLNAVALYVVVHRLCPGPHVMAWPIARMLVAAAAMVPAILATRGTFDATTRIGRAVVDLGLPIVVGAVVYFAVSILLGGDEWRRLRARPRTATSLDP